MLVKKQVIVTFIIDIYTIKSTFGFVLGVDIRVSSSIWIPSTKRV